jgi:leader peptidase (prepilin peptidase)/N-methyltransferase
MLYIILCILFTLGLAIGSFLNAFEYRIGNKLSIIKGRSICPKCKKQLAWYDNVPLLSYVVLKGKCRKCYKPISLQYPLVELATGLSFLAVWWKVGWASGFRPGTTTEIVGILCLMIVVSCLILIGLHDAKTGYIISSAVYLGIVASMIYLLINYHGISNIISVWKYSYPPLLAAFIPALFFAFLHFFSKGRWMGAGDIELAFLVGIFTGWPRVLVAFYFAFIIGAIWGLVKVFVKRNAKMKSELPFGPFLMAGALFGFIFGEQIIEFYARIILQV